MLTKIKKGLMVSALALMTLVGFSFDGEKASAATSVGCVTNAIGVAESTLCVSKDSSSVFASIERGYSGTWNTTVYWTMYLERANPDVGWDIVGSRTGYATSTSPSHREFTNVGGHGSVMRVRVLYWEDSAKTKYLGQHSKQFER